VSNFDGAVGTELLNALNAVVLTGADRDETFAALYATTSGLSIQ
jgi:multiple sugar transport system substrate-binding protein